MDGLILHVVVAVEEDDDAAIVDIVGFLVVIDKRFLFFFFSLWKWKNFLFFKKELFSSQLDFFSLLGFSIRTWFPEVLDTLSSTLFAGFSSFFLSLCGDGKGSFLEGVFTAVREGGLYLFLDFQYYYGSNDERRVNSA
jgi:hypothetical protein